jgi:hypothetical protein
MKILIDIAKSWYSGLQKRSVFKFIIIVFILLLLIVLPIVGSFLPFTYLAL